MTQTSSPYRSPGAAPEPKLKVAPSLGAYRIVRDGTLKQFEIHQLRMRRRWPWFWLWERSWFFVEKHMWLGHEELALKEANKHFDRLLLAREKHTDPAGRSVVRSEQ